jgi:hypothetical protein
MQPMQKVALRLPLDQSKDGQDVVLALGSTAVSRNTRGLGVIPKDGREH